MTPAFSARTAWLLSLLIGAGFFLLLAWIRAADIYWQHFYDRDMRITASWQLGRLLYIPYLFWLQYAAGAGALYLLNRRSAPLSGLAQLIACFCTGTALWHVLLLIVGLAGLYFYPVMLLLAGASMLASLPHMARLLASLPPLPVFTRLEKLLALFAFVALGAFLALKATYPSGGHDFFNHYFPFYRQVVETGKLIGNDSWYHFYYSKGLGLFFMSMILLDPLAVHPAASIFILMAALVIYDLLRTPSSRLLSLWGVTLFFLLYLYTAGRGLFAANGGWGDIEKTHEIGAALILACLWCTVRWITTRHRSYAMALHAANVALVIVSFGSFVVIGMFYGLLLTYALIRRRRDLARFAFFAGASLGLATLAMAMLNYAITGIPSDQLAIHLWKFLDWQKIVKTGNTLELYSLLYDHQSLALMELDFWKVAPKMFFEFNRIYMFWPLLSAGVLLAAWPLWKKKKLPLVFWIMALFILGAYLVGMFFGGRSQPISFFRFSSFNYAPMLLISLLLWGMASCRALIFTIAFFVIFCVPLTKITASRALFETKRQVVTAAMLASGAYSIRDAIQDQSGRVARMPYGGIYPSMEKIVSAMPPNTRIWSLHNHSYCMLPGCNVQQYYSQITSRRWYDVALLPPEEGKKILQEEGLNFIFYSRNIPLGLASSTKDQLIVFYPGMHPDLVGKYFGVLWTDGWDYLLTWKENSTAPLDDNFLDSWRMLYQKAAERTQLFPLLPLARIVKKAIEEDARHPPDAPFDRLKEAH